MEIYQHRLQNSPLLSSFGLQNTSKTISLAAQTSPMNSFLNMNNQIVGTTKGSLAEMKPTEDFLRSELNKLSVKEQTEALDDIYGVSQGLQETADIIERSLLLFQYELQQGNFPVYEMALRQNRAYVEDSGFRLKFLRANRHNVSKAVIQMENFLRHKATYFGFDNVAREVTLEALTTEEIEILLSGLFHLQDGTDRSGRIIIYCFNSMMGKYSAESLIRVMYYFYFKIVIRTPGVQQKGVTLVYYDESTPFRQPNLPQLHTMFKTVDFFNSLPLRVSAMHLCLKPVSTTLALQNRLLGFTVKALTRETRARIKLHYGSDSELQDILGRHGVPSDTFPVAKNGRMRREILNVWFHLYMGSDSNYRETFNRMCVKTEGDDDEDGSEDSDSDMTVDEAMYNIQEERIQITNKPRPLRTDAQFNIQPTSITSTKEASKQPADLSLNSIDVYLGRGRDIQNYPGNVRFREFLAAYHSDYDSVPRHERGKIAKSLMDVLKTRGVRFFQRNDTKQWAECDSAIVEKKVGQLLREFRKQKNKKSKNDP